MKYRSLYLFLSLSLSVLLWTADLFRFECIPHRWPGIQKSPARSQDKLNPSLLFWNNNQADLVVLLLPGAEPEVMLGVKLLLGNQLVLCGRAENA